MTEQLSSANTKLMTIEQVKEKPLPLRHWSSFFGENCWSPKAKPINSLVFDFSIFSLNSAFKPSVPLATIHFLIHLKSFQAVPGFQVSET